MYWTAYFMERVNRLELLPEAWKAAVLPLHHTRVLHMLVCYLVGAEGFEPPTLWSQTRCATRLRYAPSRPTAQGVYLECCGFASAVLT